MDDSYNAGWDAQVLDDRQDEARLLMSLRAMAAVQPRAPVLTVTNFDDLLGDAVAAASAQREAITLDLQHLEFIDLFAMLGLAYLCGNLQDAGGCRVRLELGETGACSFLTRAGFFDILPASDALEFDIPPARIEYLRLYRGANRALLELTPIDSDEVIAEVLEKFIGMLRRRLRYPKEEAYDLAIILSELCHNVLDHHPDPAAAGGVAAMQVHDGQRGRFMQVVVGDHGQGIRRTLGRNPVHAALPSDTAAILRSVELGVSEHEEQTRGNGLYHLRRLVNRHRGALHIRSGCGKVYYRVDRDEPGVFSVPRLSGTQFSITLPVKSS